MNEVSSRSHCIVTVTVERALPDGTVQQGKLCMVVLAGRWGARGGAGPAGCCCMAAAPQQAMPMPDHQALAQVQMTGLLLRH